MQNDPVFLFAGVTFPWDKLLFIMRPYSLSRQIPERIHAIFRTFPDSGHPPVRRSAGSSLQRILRNTARVPYPDALKLYTGFMMSTMSTVSRITPMMSSGDLYAIGASSRVESSTEVEYTSFIMSL